MEVWVYLCQLTGCFTGRLDAVDFTPDTKQEGVKECCESLLSIEIADWGLERETEWKV